MPSDSLLIAEIADLRAKLANRESFIAIAFGPDAYSEFEKVSTRLASSEAEVVSLKAEIGRLRGKA